MALKATIYKCDLQLADLDRNYYADFALTLARHPSETEERMMVRLCAFAFCAEEGLQFCKGVSDADEPDLWHKDLTGAIQTWIEIGQPDERRLTRACGRAERVLVFAHGGRAAQVWWSGLKPAVRRHPKITVRFLAAEAVAQLTGLAERSMRLAATIQDGQLLLSGERGTITLELLDPAGSEASAN